MIQQKIFPKKNEMIYCSVAFEGSKKPYYYLTHDPSLDLGDEVEVPVGQENHLKIGHIVKIECFRPAEAPFPVDQIKEIAGKTLIKKAIQNFKSDQTTQNLITLMNALTDSLVWVPCNVKWGESDQQQIKEMLSQAEENQESLAGKTFTSKEDVHLVPDILQSGDEYYFPVFSSREEMGEYGKHFSKVPSPFMNTIAMARNNPNYEISGIVVNAFTNSAALKWDLLDIMEENDK